MMRSEHIESSGFWRSPKLEWLSAVPEVERDAIRARSHKQIVDRGGFVFRPGPVPSVLYFLETGLVRIHRVSDAGAEVTLEFIRPGQVFGELPFLLGGSWRSYAQAFCASTVWCTPHEVVLQVVGAHPELVLAITKQLAGRLLRIEDHLTALVFRSVRARLASMLLELAEDFGHSEGSAVTLDLPLSQEELSTLIGSTRPTVNAELKALIAAGMLTLSQHRVTLRDVAGLRQLACAR
jgi:CRP/FNR family transcriptional regulator